MSGSTRSTVRVGIVGAGGIATGAHLPALRAVNEQAGRQRAAVVGIADVDPARAASTAAEHGIPAHFPSAEELLAATRPDLLIVCTPPGAHRSAVVAGLAAGAWVWCEKPPMLSLEEYDDVARLEREGGPYASYVVQHRFGSAAQHLRDQMSSGRLGRPLVSVCHTLWYRGHDYYDVPWRGKWATEGGGPAMGHGIHQMDLYLDLMGEWAEVTAVADAQDRAVETEDTSLAIVRFESGALGSIVNTVLAPRETSYLRFDFTNGTVEVEHLYGYTNDHWRYTPSPHLPEDQRDAWLPQASTASSHAAQLGELLDSMDRGERPRASGADGRRTLEFIAALYQSAETGRPVRRSDLTASGPYYTGMHDPAVAYPTADSPQARDDRPGGPPDPAADAAAAVVTAAAPTAAPTGAGAAHLPADTTLETSRG